MRRIARFGVLSAVALGSLSLMAGPALASGTPGATDTTPINVAITAGSLTISAPPAISFSASLAGVDQQVVQTGAAPSFYVSDQTGSGNGWNVTIVSSPLISNDVANVATPYTVPANWSMFLNADNSAEATASQLVPALFGAPADTANYTMPSGDLAALPLQIPGINAASNVIPAVVTTAAVKTGLGDFVVPFDMWQNIPANAYAGTYSSVVTWTVASGPIA
jgi:hypothetical protein